MKRTYGIRFYTIKTFEDTYDVCELCLEGYGDKTLRRLDGFRPQSKNCETRCEHCDRKQDGRYDAPTDGWCSPLPDTAPGEYWVTAMNDAGAVMKVAGPFARHSLALAAVTTTRENCVDPRAHWYSWGTSRTESAS